MRRGAALAVCLSGCVLIGAPSSFTRSAPASSALVFGRFLVDEMPLREMRLGRFGDVMFETGTNALLDDKGNFAFVLEPGAWYLHWYEPASGGRTRFLDSRRPPDPVFQLEVKAGDVKWLGAWTERVLTNKKVVFRRVDSVKPAEVLKELSARAAGSAWEPLLAAELERLRLDVPEVPPVDESGPTAL